MPADVADDIVAEAFARVLAAIRAGGGPSHAFRGYLLTAVRHLAHDWLQARRRLTVVGDLDVQATDETAGAGRVNPGIGTAAETQAEARDEARLVTRAFGRLPARWREVLWQLEVEGKAPAAVAPMFGLSANGVSALAMRAREGLRQAYLEEHVGANIPAACRTYAAEFGAGARGRLSQRRRAVMQEHLGHCPACQDLFTELTELNSRLGAILTPAALAAASSALGSAKRASVLRAHLAGHWHTWRWHPVTSVTGAAAGVAVVGGMLLAVNITPVTSPPAHAATSPALPASSPWSSAPRKRHPGGGGAATRAAAHSPAGPGSPASTGSLASLVSPASPVSPASTGSPPAPTPPSGAAPVAPAGPSQASQPSSGGGTLATNTPASPAQTIANTAGNTVTSLANTATNTVSGLADTAGTTVTGVTTNATSGLVSTATNTVTGATSSATGAVTGIASTASTTVATTGKTVSNVAATAASTVTGAATNAVSGAASTVTATGSNTTSTASSPARATIATAASTAVTTTTQTVAAAASSSLTKAATPPSSTDATDASTGTTTGAAASTVGEVAGTAAGLGP